LSSTATTVRRHDRASSSNRAARTACTASWADRPDAVAPGAGSAAELDDSTLSASAASVRASRRVSGGGAPELACALMPPAALRSACAAGIYARAFGSMRNLARTLSPALAPAACNETTSNVDPRNFLRRISREIASDCRVDCGNSPKVVSSSAAVCSVSKTVSNSASGANTPPSLVPSTSRPTFIVLAGTPSPDPVPVFADVDFVAAV